MIENASHQRAPLRGMSPQRFCGARVDVVCDMWGEETIRSTLELSRLTLRLLVPCIIFLLNQVSEPQTLRYVFGSSVSFPVAFCFSQSCCFYTQFS